MSLYARISSCYDDLFPVNPSAVEAIELLIPAGADRRILDLGAATGSHTRAFADRGWNSLGIELDGEMALLAASRAHVVQGSILDAEAIVLGEYGFAAKFGAALCLGNTLPHLDPGTLTGFFASMRRLLSKDSPLIIQTLNYSNPHVGPGFIFPVIRTGNICFERRYEDGGSLEALIFATKFSAGDQVLEDRTSLHPLTPDKLLTLLEQAGFEDVETRSGWKTGKFDVAEDLYMLAVAR